MKSGVVTLRHAGIVVTDLDRSLDFYEGLLGLKIKKQAVESGSYADKILGLKNVNVITVKMEAGEGGIIELLQFKSHPRLKKKRDACVIGVTHVAFTVKNLDKEYKRLVAAGIFFNSSPQLSPDGYAKVVFCKDPDGTLIELVEVL